jgi:hypothetical protein
MLLFGAVGHEDLNYSHHTVAHAPGQTKRRSNFQRRVQRADALPIDDQAEEAFYRSEHEAKSSMSGFSISRNPLLL